MITIYAPNAQDFSTLGLGALAPYECVIEEQAGGMYELTMTHPMDAEGKWLNIGVGCIVKAPAPRENAVHKGIGFKDVLDPQPAFKLNARGDRLCLLGREGNAA